MSKRTDETVLGWEGSVGPFPGQYDTPHVYARGLGSSKHVQAAPGVPIPDEMRP